jgi:3-oxoacyl-[acyl-carrier protein] reductase
VAETIVWLASERASYITGQTVLVDGGMYKGL